MEQTTNRLQLANDRLKTEFTLFQANIRDSIHYPPLSLEKEQEFDREIQKLKNRIASLKHLDGQDLYIQTLEQRVREMITYIEENYPKTPIPKRWRI